MTDKATTINSAYSQMRISGLTVIPTPEDQELALFRLESMMAEFELRNICLHYNFEETPDPATDTGVVHGASHMMQTNLAIRLIADFNKVVPATLNQQAMQSLSTVSGWVALTNLRQVQAPRRMARGSGNTLRFNRWTRFERPTILPPNDCENNKMFADDIQDYVESFHAYLIGETIASFTIKATNGLTLQSSSSNDETVSYRILAVDSATSGTFQQVTIIVTTSAGRIESRLIDFEIKQLATA